MEVNRAVRTVPSVAVVTVACSTPARAHAWGHAGGHFDPALVTGAAVVLGAIAGVIAVDNAVPDGRLVLVLAGVLGGVGLVALGGAILASPAVAAAGCLAGAVVARLVHRRAATAVLAIGAHRFVEGAALAALVLADALLGILAALALVGHVCVETAALGGFCVEHGRARALGAVLGVQAAFVVGAGIGTVALPALPPAGRIGVLATVGLLLALSGGRELRERFGGIPATNGRGHA